MALLSNPYILVAVGFLLLIKGADELIEGASNIASRFGLSKLVVGLTIVAFGTSAPELTVNVMDAVAGTTAIGFGNIIGSNIANLLLILGIVALVSPLSLSVKTVWQEIPMSLFAVVVLFFAANQFSGLTVTPSVVNASDGYILLTLFAAFMVYMAMRIRAERGTLAQEGPRRRVSVVWSVIRLLAGIVALFFGGQWVVAGAKTIAAQVGLSERVIGATVIAFGTSLPELVTSVKSALRRELDLSVGNIIGSNIFNILWVLGVTALIEPIAASVGANRDMLFLIAITVLLFVFMFRGRTFRLERTEGGVFIALYAGYILFKFLGN